MSVYNDQVEQERQRILRFALKVIAGPSPAAAVAADRHLVDTITPAQVITLVDDLVRQEIPMEELKTGINKLLNLFHKSLTTQIPRLPPDNTLISALRLNNRRAEALLETLRPLIIEFLRDPDETESRSQIRETLTELLRFTDHYTIKENAVFPRLESAWPDYRCLTVMWSFHDDIRRNIKKTLALLSQAEPDIPQFNTLIGQIFFNVNAIIFREEKILYPHMLATLSEADWTVMQHQSRELDWPFEQPEPMEAEYPSQSAKPMEPGALDLGSGRLRLDQLIRMLNHLPLDMTLVDEADRVVYFSEGPSRIFPRSRAIIGRTVQNCHPPESVDTVQQILDCFRSGERNQAEFWIDMPRGKILIRYYALRDDDGRYKGTLEVSQDIGDIQAIRGERRLLDWT